LKRLSSCIPRITQDQVDKEKKKNVHTASSTNHEKGLQEGRQKKSLGKDL